MILVRMLLVFCLSLPFVSFAQSQLYLNFAISSQDPFRVDSDESSLSFFPNLAASAGTQWNNIFLRSNFSNGAATAFTQATQSGSSISVLDASGEASEVDLTSSGSFAVGSVSQSGLGGSQTGDAGLLASHLLLNQEESLQFTGLSEWASSYRIYFFFELAEAQTFGISASDGSTSQTRWSRTLSGQDSDANDDGVIDWLVTEAESEGAAVEGANYAMMTGFSGDTLTITAASAESAVLSAMVLVRDAPADDTLSISSFSASPASAKVGDVVTLSWEVGNAESVEIAGRTFEALEGSAQFEITEALDENQIFTLTASDETQSRRASTSVEILINNTPIDVYLFSGQSNMVGKAEYSLIDPSYQQGLDRHLFYIDSTRQSAAESTAFEELITHQDSLSVFFGPELGFAQRMNELRPKEQLAFFKFARAARNLETDFNPGADVNDTANWGDHFTGLVETVEEGIQALKDRGYDPTIKGMLWFQGEADARAGESDSVSATAAADYGENLAHFINRCRDQFAADIGPEGMRFISTQVLPYAPAGGDVEARYFGRDLVRQAVLDLAEDSGHPLSVANCSAIETNEVDHQTFAQIVPGNTDEVHPAEQAILAIGSEMAERVLRLQPIPYLDWAAQNGLNSDPLADDNSDGQINLIDFASLGIPFQFAGRVSQERPHFLIDRNLNASGVSMVVQGSMDLEDWTTHVPRLQSSEISDDGVSLLEFTPPLDLTTPAVFYYRAIFE